jgi:hypothetical protein
VGPVICRYISPLLSDTVVSGKLIEKHTEDEKHCIDMPA